jgi:hypothetical protein
MARGVRRTIETEGMQIGKDQTFQMPATGAIDHNDFRNDFEIVDGPQAMGKAEELAFMEEPVEVMVSPTTDKNAERLPQVAVNGVNQYFMRGKRMSVKRKFVEALARAKKTGISTMPAKDQDGADTMNIVQETGLKYPFSVSHDRNPNGSAWLENVLAEA